MSPPPRGRRSTIFLSVWDVAAKVSSELNYTPIFSLIFFSTVFVIFGWVFFFYIKRFRNDYKNYLGGLEVIILIRKPVDELSFSRLLSVDPYSK
jgi:hypothetical protein